MGKNQQINYDKGNPRLINIHQDFRGTPVDEQGRFINLEFPFNIHVKDLLRWKLTANPFKKEKQNDTFQLTLRSDFSFLNTSEDCLVWLGHASFFMRLAGKVFLTDPVFYKIPFVKRYVRPALMPEQFKQVDYLLISHDHRDHCDEKSIRKLCTLFPKLTILTGLNMQSLLKPWVNHCSIQMAGWYQQYETEPVKISFLPTRHWAKRGLNDDNTRLWGAFVFQSKNKTIYFGGDSGYADHYKVAKALFPSIDVAMIGCGAFRPEWFMAPNHSSPEYAVRAFNELGAKNLVPMHYGMFDLSDEAPGEPYRLMKQLEAEGKIQGNLRLADLGEPMLL